jgi:hypothetical protein
MNKKTETEIMPVQNDAEILIAKAIDKGVDVSTMERLLAMRRELKAEFAKAEFDKAMAKFQSECPVISKNATAGSGNFGYKYATLEHIVSQVRDILSGNGFSYTFDSKKTDNSFITYCHVKHVAGHSETSQFEIAIDGSARMNISQKDGAANSYGKRYAFSNAFGILTGDEDTDSNLPEAKQIAPVKDFQYGNGNGAITIAQMNGIRDLLAKKGKSEKKLCDRFNVTGLNQLTHSQATEIEQKLNGLPDVNEPEIDFDEVDKALSGK